MIRILCYVFLSLIIVSEVTAQKQLVVLKQQKVLLRLYPGDEFVFKLKSSKQVRRSYVNNLFDTAVVAHRDVIPLHRLDKIYFDRRNFLNVVGGLLVTGGLGYLLIDQVNVVLVQGDSPNIDKNVGVASAVMVATGLPMILLKRKYVKVGGKYRVLVAEKGSVFYQPDFRQAVDD